MSLMVKEILQIAERRLSESHCMDPKLDSEIIFCDMLNLDKTQLFLRRPTMLDEETCDKFFDLIDIRAGGKPVQYITGKQDFMGLTFKVNEHVLIPRQDTETLVEGVIEELKEKKKKVGNMEILDLCCGSGAIGISLAKYFPGIKVMATDISEEALQVAQENAEKIRLIRKIKFMQSDMFERIKKGFGGKKFDYILSNPPYIATRFIPILQREIKEFEPLTALDGGEDGLDFYRVIFSQASNYLKKKGRLYVEIAHDQGKEILALIEETKAFGDVEIIKDATNLDRVVRCTLLSDKTLKDKKLKQRTPKETKEKEVTESVEDVEDMQETFSQGEEVESEPELEEPTEEKVLEIKTEK